MITSTIILVLDTKLYRIFVVKADSIIKALSPHYLINCVTGILPVLLRADAYP